MMLQREGRSLWMECGKMVQSVEFFHTFFVDSPPIPQGREFVEKRYVLIINILSI